MDGKVQYFVIYKPQQGELTPAYSFMDEETMEQAMNQAIIAKAFVVPYKQIHSKEEVLELLERYKTEK